MADSKKPVVLITGFGPFRSYDKNASWEAVKLLVMDEIEIVAQEIEVAYEQVDKCVPELWTTHKPSLVIHCGVSGLARSLVLETRAHSADYKSPDVRGQQPHCQDGRCEMLKTGIDVQLVCDKLNGCFQDKTIKLQATASTDAGRYLCEYIYYCSLKHDPNRTLFIHVPELTYFSAEEIAEALACAIRIALQSLAPRECLTESN